MSELALNDKSISALYKLDVEFKRATGLHHRLSCDSAIFDLLKKAFISSSPKIKAAYFEFIDTLNVQQKSMLNNNGIVPIQINKQEKSTESFISQLFNMGKRCLQ